jgi:Helix-turn-helix domain
MSKNRFRDLTREDEFSPYRKFNGSILPNWLQERTEIPLSAKLVYARLSQYAGGETAAYPRVRTLAAACAISERTAQNAIKTLADVGLIRVQERCVQGLPSLYFFREHPWMGVEKPKNGARARVATPVPDSDVVSTTYATTPPQPTAGAPRNQPQEPPATAAPFKRESGEENQEKRFNTHKPDLAPLAGLVRSRTPEPRTFAPTPEPSGEYSEDGKFSGENEEKKPADLSDTPLPVDRRMAVADQYVTAAKEKTLAAQQAQLARAAKAESRARNLDGETESPQQRVKTTRIETSWRRLMGEHHPAILLGPWGFPERRAVKQLVTDYGEEVVEQTLRYVVANWDTITVRFFKRASILTIQTIQRFHSTFVPEAQLWNQHQQAEAEWQAWHRECPGEAVPRDLQARYLQAQKQLALTSAAPATSVLHDEV